MEKGFMRIAEDVAGYAVSRERKKGLIVESDR